MVEGLEGTVGFHSCKDIHPSSRDLVLTADWRMNWPDED